MDVLARGHDRSQTGRCQRRAVMAKVLRPQIRPLGTRNLTLRNACLSLECLCDVFDGHEAMRRLVDWQDASSRLGRYFCNVRGKSTGQAPRTFRRKHGQQTGSGINIASMPGSLNLTGQRSLQRQAVAHPARCPRIVAVLPETKSWPAEQIAKEPRPGGW